MKSTAPAFSVLRAEAASPCAVSRITGHAMPRAASSACTSGPDLPGMRRSSSTHADGLLRVDGVEERLARADGACVTVQAQEQASESRTAASSSTM